MSKEKTEFELFVEANKDKKPEELLQELFEAKQNEAAQSERIETLNEMISDYEQDSIIQEEALKELNAKLSELENNPSKKAAKPKLKIGKDTYQVVIPRIQLGDGTIVTIADLKENKLKVGGLSIQEHLVKIKSGMIQKV